VTVEVVVDCVFRVSIDEYRIVGVNFDGRCAFIVCRDKICVIATVGAGWNGTTGENGTFLRDSDRRQKDALSLIGLTNRKCHREWPEQ